ncbi:MAG: serine/threonine protein kinase, partial [Nannocystaceae bacterium]|nr:serine/threonine protein kinase [Nannocystaceae bacterium]
MDPEAITLQADKAATTNPTEEVRTLASKGTSVGRYIVLREVGRGAMGAVFVAIDPKLDRRVALKLLLDDTHCPTATARMIREAQSLASLNHPNVVTVYDAGEHDEHVFIAMEFVEGKTLRQWQGRELRPWRDVLAAYQQAAMGLAAAHAHGVTHRDFKPDNAMIDAEGRVRVMDFGLARRGEAEGDSDATTSGEREPSALTQTGSIMGTPAYMSPEQFRNGEVGPASDQFSLCVALYEALVGERPFQAETLADLTAAVTRGEVHDIPRGVRAPGWLLQVVRKGLSVAPEDRHASMDALLAAFGRGLGTRRRWALLAGVTALGALSVTGALRPGVADPCREAAEEIRGRWTTDRIDALQAAFENTGHADASDSWMRVERRVDGFIDDWVQESDHLCGAWRDTLTPALLGVRQRCLTVQQGHLDALLQAFTDPTAETVAFASAAAAGLPGPAECAQLDDADHAPPLHSVHTVLAAQRLAARALVRRHVGDSAGALKTYEAALDALGEVEAPRARTRILAGLANVLFFAGAVDRAERTLGEAQALAAKSGDMRLTAKLWLERLVQLNIHRREQLERQAHLL